MIVTQAQQGSRPQETVGPAYSLQAGLKHRTAGQRQWCCRELDGTRCHMLRRESGQVSTQSSASRSPKERVMQT